MYRSLIVDKLNESNISMTEFAEKTGLEQQQVAKFIGGKIELDFDVMLTIVQELAPEQEFTIMEKYIESVENYENIICSLEYCSTNHLIDRLKFLLDKLSNSSIHQLKSWRFLYQCFYDYMVDTMPDEEIINKLENFNALDQEMRVFKNIILIYLYHFNLKKNKLSLDLSKECFEDLYFTKESFLKNSFKARVHFVLTKTYLDVLGEVTEARFHALKVLELAYSRRIQIRTLVWLGISHFFDDYTKSMQYLRQAYDIAEMVKIGLQTVKSNMLFLNNYWGYQQTLPETSDKAEMAHYLIKNGKFKEGLKILDEMEETAFRLYYRWLATKDPKYLLKSRDLFQMNKSTFFIRYLIEPEMNKTEHNIMVN